MKHLSLVALFGFSFLAGCGGGGSSSPPPPPPSPPPANSAPVSAAQSTATDPATPLSGSLQATDVDGDTLTYSVVSNPVSGTVVLSGTGNSAFEYTPNGGFVGSDSFTFDASDGSLSSAVATVMIEVNTKPVATGASFSTSDLGVLAATVSGNDAEGDVFTFAVATQPSKGTVTAFDAATGDFSYQPTQSEDGMDSFTVTAADAFQTSSEATVSIEIFGWQGVQQIGTLGQEFASTNGLFFDANGNLVFGGATAGQLAATPPAGDLDGFIRKIDRRGNELWTAQFGDANPNNARIIKQVPGTTDILTMRSDQGLPTASIVKYDDAGNLLLDAPVDFQGIAAIISTAYQGGVDANGDAYVLSWRTTATSILTKVNGQTGATDWQLLLSGTTDDNVTPFNSEWSSLRLRSIDFDATGNAIISGWYIPDGNAPPRNCALCSFVAGYDTDGNQLWVTELDAFAQGCTANSEAALYRVSVAPDQTLWATGFGSSDGSQTGIGFGQVTKFSADGTQLLWSDCFDAPAAGTSLFSFTPARFAVNGDGLVLVSDVTPDDPVSNPLGSTDVTLSRLSSAGSIVFRRTISTTRADATTANVTEGDVIEDTQGIVYITGATDGEFVPGAALGDTDAFVLRLGADGVPAN